MLYSKFLLLIYFIYSNLYLLIPYPWFVAALFPLPFGNHRFIFYVCEFVSVLCVCVHSLSYVQLFATLWTVPSRLLCPWDFSGKNTGVGHRFLLQRIFPTQGSNLHLLYLLHCRWILSPLSHQGSPISLCSHHQFWASSSL